MPHRILLLSAGIMLTVVAALWRPPTAGHASGQNQKQAVAKSTGEVCWPKPAAHHVGNSSLVSYLLLGRAEAGSTSTWLDNWTRQFGLRPKSVAPQPEASNTGTTSALAAPITVDISVGPGNQLVFQPSVVTINAGDTVRWTFASVGHDIVAAHRA